MAVSGCANHTTGKRGWSSSRPVEQVYSTRQLVKPMMTDRVIIQKGERKMTVLRQGQVVAVFPVALGRQPTGAKACEGDMRTPEGTYTVTEHKADSDFYKALRISYPEQEDIERAQEKGCKPGGNIMIHGLQNGFGYVGASHRSVDWTRGCIAVTNQEMDRLWTLVPTGTVVEIRP